MARRAALALVRTPPVRPALPSSLRPGRRSLAVALACLGLVGLSYLGAHETGVFAFRTVEVSGASRPVAADVRKALVPLEGRSLVALDPADVEHLLESVPTVHAAHVDRAFPHGLAIEVEPEEPLAVFRDGARAWLVAASGRVIEPMEPTARRRLPRVRIDVSRTPTVGAQLPGDDAEAALAVLSALPRGFPGHVLYSTAGEEGMVLVLADGPEIRLGEPTMLARKLAAAAAVLRSLPEEERIPLGYLDASVLERVVGGADPQPSSEASDSSDEIPANVPFDIGPG
jgi:cell division protein FtsQ